jgi:DedD protein
VAEAASAAAKAVTGGDKNIPLSPVNKASDATKNAAKVVGAASSPVKVTDAKPPVVKPTDAAPVQAGRYILQVGAFADTTRAHEVRLKLEHAGLKTYTHVADTPEGKRIRVRVGPFSAKAEAEKVAVKIKKLNLPAALLTL